MARNKNQEILNAINTIATHKVNNAPYNKEFEGIVIDVLGNNLYKVKINNNDYEVSSYGDTSFNKGNVVKIIVPNNNINKAYILPKGGYSNNNQNSNEYILPVASNEILGGIKSGNDISIDSEGYVTVNNSNKLSNHTEDYYLNRENHTGTQTASTISDFQSTVSNNNDVKLNTANRHFHANKDILDNITASFSTEEKDKLSSIEYNADVNKIEKIQKNGIDLDINNKTVNITVPTKTSDITNDSGFITSFDSINGNAATASKLETPRKINGVEFDGTKDITIEDSTKEPLISVGKTYQYFRGDKTWQTLDKSAVGLSNVDNTSDLNKPISIAVQEALDAKIDISRINDNGTSTELWTASKIKSEISLNLPTGVLQYNGDILSVPQTITMDIPSLEDYKTSNVEILLLRNNRWDKALHGIDYVYGFTDENKLEIEFLNTGTYKVNYAFVAVGNVPFTVISNTQPIDQNTNDLWIEILE